jgi:hypothetical protein
MRQPEIRPSARKHGISDERMLFVVRTCRLPFDHGEDSGQILFVGIDPHGVPLEVVAFEDDAGELTIIHAMRMRRKYRDLLRKVVW